MNWYQKRKNIRHIQKVFQALELPKDGKIIDVSCGGGRLLKTIENHYPELDLYGVDVTPGYLARNPDLSNINFFTAEADKLPFEDNTFDVTLCSFSLHHYNNAQSVVNEISRITKSSEIIYLADFSPKNKLSQHIYNMIGCNEPYHFEKYYTKNELEMLLKNINSKIIESFVIQKLPRIVLYKIENF